MKFQIEILRRINQTKIFTHIIENISFSNLSLSYFEKTMRIKAVLSKMIFKIKALTNLHISKLRRIQISCKRP